MNITLRKYALYLFVASNVGLVGYFWSLGSWSMVTSGSLALTLIAFGRLFGLCAEFTILIQLMLIGRVTWIEQLFGFDKLNRVHRLIGYSIGLFLLGHPILLTFGYALQSQVSVVSQFLMFLSDWEDVISALLGLIIFYTVIVSSIFIVRKRLRYEAWYIVHLLVYLAILLAFSHQTNGEDFGNQTFVGYWYILNFTIFGLLFLYRFVRPLYTFWRHRFMVEKVVAENNDVHSIYITGRQIEYFHFQAGQYANLTFLDPHHFFTHPFSFSTAFTGSSLRFSIKTAGDFTAKVKDIKPGTYVIIDGPLGRFVEEPDSQKYLFLAGGIGITPIRALIESLSKRGKDIVLLYAVKQPKDIVFEKEFESYEQRTHFVFSQVVEEGKGQFEHGRIDLEKLNRLVPDFREREIYLCGPDAMMSALVQLLKEQGIASTQLHYERFAF